ncbi:hypothetical protein GCM10027261_22030 [Geodermatophilus arenarius]|uniref:Uncharacterized protein n=1 Tax=Geodermatophilus arenarius TaxID=1137990 RepID=A0ABV9LH91_9ACTN
MRKKILLATAAGALAVGGLAFAVPAVADDDTTTTDSVTSAEERIRDALSGLVDDGSITQEQADEVAATLGDAGVWHGGRGGWHGGWGGGWGGGFPVVAETLGLSEEELRTALEADGATLASVAEDRGVAVEDLVAALVAAAEERIATAVEEGHLTQEEADERLADLEAGVTEFVQSADGDGPWWGGRGGPDDEGD